MRPAFRLGAVVSVALAVPIVPFLLVGELPGGVWLSATDDAALVFAASGAGLLAADLVLPVPSSVVIALLGARLGAPGGALAAWLGLTAGHLAGYAVGRLAPSRVAVNLPERPSALVLFATRAVPILAEALALTAGVMRTPPRAALLALAAGDAVYAALLAGGAALAMRWGSLVGAVLLALVVAGVAALVWRFSGARVGRAPAKP